MIACTVVGDVPNVGGISEASTTPSRPLVPAPMKMIAAALAQRVRDDLDAVRDAFPFFLNGGDDLAILVEDHVDDVRDRGFVDGEADRVDGFGWQGLPLRLCCHAERSVGVAQAAGQPRTLPRRAEGVKPRAGRTRDAP